MAVARKMLFVLFALALLFTLPAAAQAQVMLSVNAGASFASLEGDDAEGEFGESLGTRTGLLAGVHLGFAVSPVFSVAPGLYYAQKGAKAEEDGASVALKLDYIEVPVLGVFALTGADRPLGVSVFLGPSFAFEVGCTFEIAFGEIDESGDCDEDNEEDERRKLDIGAIFGAGVAFPLSERLAVTVNGGLDMGLRSLDTSTANDDIKNQMWFLIAGLSFPLGG